MKSAMSEISHPIPPKSSIVKAVLWSALGAVAILVCAVLPAEYGIDPIGAGKFFGFSRLYVPEGATMTNALTNLEKLPVLTLEKAGSDPSVKRPIEADKPAPAEQYALREDSIQMTVPAGKGIEYKTYMLKQGQMKYEWKTNKGILFSDFHGEVAQETPAKDVYYESYTLVYSNNVAGTFLAPYEGKHGWYFKNTSNDDITVTLRLKGQYSL